MGERPGRSISKASYLCLFDRKFCQGRGPFRWVCLSGDEEDLARTDEAVLQEFPDDERLSAWMDMARERVPIVNLPARTCWLALGERDRFGRKLNQIGARWHPQRSGRHVPGPFG